MPGFEGAERENYDECEARIGPASAAGFRLPCGSAISVYEEEEALSAHGPHRAGFPQELFRRDFLRPPGRCVIRGRRSGD